MLRRARSHGGRRFLFKFEDSDALGMRRFEHGVNDRGGLLVGDRKVYFHLRLHLRGRSGSCLVLMAAAGTLFGQVKSEDAELPHALVKIIQGRTLDDCLYSFHITTSSGEVPAR